MGDGTGLGDYPVAEAGRAEAHNLIARCKSASLAADAAHDAGKFEAQRRAGKTVFDGLVGKQAKGVHDVAEIETGGMDVDFDFTIAGCAARVGFPAQIAQLAREREAEAYRWGFGLPAFSLRSRLKAQARCIARAASGQNDFLFVVRLFEFSIQCGGDSVKRQRIFQIDQADSVVGGFVDQGSTESP